MLMMLALCLGALGKTPFAADAHDAGLVFGGYGKNPLRLMLMMLALFGGFGKNPLRLMLMMLALFGDLGKTLRG